MPLINTPIEPFATTAYRSDVFVNVSNDGFQSRWNIIFSYPADFTFAYPTELADLQGIYVKFQSLGVEVYSVSHNSHFVHKAWYETSPETDALEFAILSDVNDVITNNFDNTCPDFGPADRSTYPIDPDGITQYIETTPEGVGRNVIELFHRIKAVRYVYNHPDGVYPVKWEEDKETLAPSFDLVDRI